MKRTLALMTAILALLFSGCTNSASRNSTSSSSENTTAPSVQSQVPESPSQAPAPSSATPEPKSSAPSTPIGYLNALESAKRYLRVMAFSYSGLISQLEFEGYTTEEATYAADNCGADWKEQAAKKAKNYLDTMSFSRQGLIDQLEFEGFTSEQAVYGVTQNGY